MLYQAKHFEGVRHATRRDHLMPVEPATYPVAPWETRALAVIWLVVLPAFVALGAWVLS